MRSHMKIGKHAVQPGAVLTGIGVGLAIGAGILGWMWKKRHAARGQHDLFSRRGRRWPQAVPVK